MNKPQALIVFTGGYSGEAVISRKSAAMIMAQIDRTRFEPVLVHINPKGWFFETEASGEKTSTTLDDLVGDPRKFIGAFIMVHGTPGEDDPTTYSSSWFSLQQHPTVLRPLVVLSIHLAPPATS